MYSLINKINFYHSIIFFIFSCFIALIVNRFENLIISPIVCLFFILSIGISHGALDNQKGKKLSQLYNIKKSYFFYLIYSLIGISIITFWLFFPTVSLILFLFVESSSSGSMPFFPPSWISTPLPEMLVVIMTEFIFPAFAMISASFS